MTSRIRCASDVAAALRDSPHALMAAQWVPYPVAHHTGPTTVQDGYYEDTQSAVRPGPSQMLVGIGLAQTAIRTNNPEGGHRGRAPDGLLGFYSQRCPRLARSGACRDGRASRSARARAIPSATRVTSALQRFDGFSLLTKTSPGRCSSSTSQASSRHVRVQADWFEMVHRHRPPVGAARPE